MHVWGRENSRDIPSITNKAQLKKSLQFRHAEKILAYHYIHGRNFSNLDVAANGNRLYGNGRAEPPLRSSTVHLLMNFGVYTTGWVLHQRMLTSFP